MIVSPYRWKRDHADGLALGDYVDWRPSPPSTPNDHAALAKLDEVIKMVASDTRAKIEEIERRLEVRLPNDYSRFLLTRGSMNERISPANCYLQIYPVDDVIPINEAGEIQDRFPGALVIGGDGSREMLAYDFRQSQSSLVLLDITAEDWSDAVYQASSLTALLAQLPERGWFFD